jgi:hypothetical protein
MASAHDADNNDSRRELADYSSVRYVERWKSEVSEQYGLTAYKCAFKSVYTHLCTDNEIFVHSY